MISVDFVYALTVQILIVFVLTDKDIEFVFNCCSIVRRSDATTWPNDLEIRRNDSVNLSNDQIPRRYDATIWPNDLIIRRNDKSTLPRH